MTLPLNPLPESCVRTLGLCGHPVTCVYCAHSFNFAAPTLRTLLPLPHTVPIPDYPLELCTPPSSSYVQNPVQLEDSGSFSSSLHARPRALGSMSHRGRSETDKGFYHHLHMHYTDHPPSGVLAIEPALRALSLQ